MSLFGPLDLAELRALARSALPDVGTITRGGGGGGTIDPDTGDWIPDDGVVVYSGPMRIRGATTQDTDTVFGDESVTSMRFVGVLPPDVVDLLVDDVVHVTASSDPHIGARSFRVRAVSHHSYLADRRVGLEVIE